MTLDEAARLAVEDLDRRMRGTLADAHALARIQREAASLIRKRCPDVPFRISVGFVRGTLTINVQPIEELHEPVPPVTVATAVPELAPEIDLSRAAVYPVRRDSTRKSIDIDGMITDLGKWRVPPDLMNGERVGYYQAISDIMNYLQTRQRRG